MRVTRDLKSEKAVRLLIKLLGLNYINPEKVRVVRSNSKSMAYARLWGLSKVLQVGLDIKPFYVIELIDRNFSKLDCSEKVRIVVHELMHIPKTFSGHVRPHNEVFKKELRRYLRVLRKLKNDSELQRICKLLS
ncbi:MAG: hypothetical protein J7J20_05465 [Desulfurococcales archaeon]|nr:hypothetical protein [Desulfurococcales archaeon]